MLATTDVVLASQDVTVFFACVDEQPVGFMTLNACIALYAGGRFGEISELYIRPDMRSRGIAAHLIVQAVTEGCARDWKRLEVGAPPFRRERGASLSIATTGLRKLARGSA
ncbi:GNAT family N-acetyltransferase [Komagataeibacter melomenusus]|uniref:GNAT family N-acetyltransferase n=1 Tax=Komagataeibacter melomenusus TaxID=2766578 RepID=UPI0034D16FD1